MILIVTSSVTSLVPLASDFTLPCLNAKGSEAHQRLGLLSPFTIKSTLAFPHDEFPHSLISLWLDEWKVYKVLDCISFKRFLTKF